MWPMRCPWCGHEETRVIDSRSAEAGAAIRRRRACESCGKRFTTFERSEAVGLRVVKRDGSKERFDRAKLISGVEKAIKNRPVSEHQVARLADRVEEKLRRRGPDVTTQEVGIEVLAHLRRLDDVAYLRFASVYKAFKDASHFEREAVALVRSKTADEGSGSHRQN
jgi:transcriptional repressor NrdR